MNSDLKTARPITPLAAPTDAPAWMQIDNLFQRHGLAPPPYRLRDELVTLFTWAHYAKAADHATQAARIAELEGKLGEVLAATTQGLSGQWVFDHEDPEALLSGANDVLSATAPAAWPSLKGTKPMDDAVSLTKAQQTALAECARSNKARVLYWWRLRTMESLQALGLVDTWTPPSVAERPRLTRRPWILTPAGRSALEKIGAPHAR